MCGMNVSTYILSVPYGLYLFGVYMQRKKKYMCCISYNKTGGVAFCKTLFVLLMLFCEGRKSKQEKNVKNFNNKRCYKNAIEHKVVQKYFFKLLYTKVLV